MPTTIAADSTPALLVSRPRLARLLVSGAIQGASHAVGATERAQALVT
jgi:hypothetical protein